MQANVCAHTHTVSIVCNKRHLYEAAAFYEILHSAIPPSEKTNNALHRNDIQHVYSGVTALHHRVNRTATKGSRALSHTTVS